MLHLQAERSLCEQVSWQAKKLVAVLTTSMMMTEKKEELVSVPCIWYPVTFKDQTEALLDLGRKVNAMRSFCSLRSCSLCRLRWWGTSFKKGLYSSPKSGWGLYQSSKRVCWFHRRLFSKIGYRALRAHGNQWSYHRVGGWSTTLIRPYL